MEQLFSLLALASYAALFFASGLYAVWLESIKHLYEPDWTWATVVGGNSLIIITLLVQVALGVVTSPWAAVAALFIDNAVAGTPIIVWQVWGLTVRFRQLAEAARRR